MTITRDDLARSLPDVASSLTLDGLDGPVDVYRDELGIPHMRASTQHDAFFIQGFVHAQDRLWQMDYDRRRAYGRWAEFAGSAGVEQDILMRRLRLGETARADYEEFDAETRAMLEAYAAGVNAFIDTTKSLPAEYDLVGGRPERWNPWDPCASFKVRHVLMGVWHRKLWRVHQLKTIGEDLLLKLRAGSDDPDPLIVPPGVDYQQMPDGMRDSQLHAEAVSGIREWLDGSNNWAVHGSRTASGKPLVAGDPHRAIDVPNVYYQNHLACPEFDVIGMSFCGVPGFPHFGHNQWVAWCITHAGADYQDLYIERFDKSDPSRYMFKGEWRQAERRTERIVVRGASPVDVDLTITNHGSVIVGDLSSGFALAARYSSTETPNTGFRSLLPMLKARSVADLDEAMRNWVDPCNNLVMADVDGNIAYLTRGKVPRRTRVNGWLPVPGWTGQHEWDGYIPFEEQPRSLNPDTGYIITANNRIVGDEYPYYISTDWAPGNRAARIRERLQAISKATGDDMKSVHADRISIPSRSFVARLDQLGDFNDQESQAADLLRAWSGSMDHDSAAATIYSAWREQTIKLVLQDGPLHPLVSGDEKWGPAPMNAISLSGRLRAPLLALMDADDSSVLPSGETWPSLLTRSFSAAIDWLTSQLGDDMNEWQWERVHRTAAKHSLSSSLPQLAELLDPPTFGVGGDSDTPQAGGYGGIGAGDFRLSSSSVARYLFDLSDWEKSGWVVPLGSSGHPGSEHFADQGEAWSRQELYPMRYGWSNVEQSAKTRQHIDPKS
ncbi:MAG: penicillin acylase family protein [Nitrolancea sp.]